MTIIEFFKELVHPESIIKYGGLPLLTLVVFAETGLFFGFFLPGDSLLFTAGLLCAIGKFGDVSIELLGFSITVAAILGDSVGYWFGKKTGPALFKREESLLFKPKHVRVTKQFYDKHGGKALILGRFLPIIRTFAPILAGVVNMDYKKFVIYNVSGAVLWVATLVLGGYFLGKSFPWLKDHLELIIIFFIVITTIPIINTWIKESKEQKELAKQKSKEQVESKINV